jgi:hypothetical protein
VEDGRLGAHLRAAVLATILIQAEMSLATETRNCSDPSKMRLLARVGSRLREARSWVSKKLAPMADHPLVGAVADVFRTPQELALENAYLRQQLVVLRRKVRWEVPGIQSRSIPDGVTRSPVRLANGLRPACPLEASSTKAAALYIGWEFMIYNRAS